MRADRLVSLVLLLQARGRTTALALARELGVCVRTVYRDLEALAAAGVPVLAESGPGGGCQLLEHELAAAYRLAGFGGRIEVLEPPSVRELLVAAARGILGRYGERAGPADPPGAGERTVDSALGAQQ